MLYRLQRLFGVGVRKVFLRLLYVLYKLNAFITLGRPEPEDNLYHLSATQREGLVKRRSLSQVLKVNLAFQIRFLKVATRPSRSFNSITSQPANDHVQVCFLWCEVLHNPHRFSDSGIFRVMYPCYLNTCQRYTDMCEFVAVLKCLNPENALNYVNLNSNPSMDGCTWICQQTSFAKYRLLVICKTFILLSPAFVACNLQ